MTGTLGAVGVAMALPVACWLATGARWVPRGQWLAVTRAGTVSRVHGPGPAWRWPLVEQYAWLDSEPRSLPITGRGTTADGTRLVVLADACVQQARPEPGAPYADPWAAAEAAAEETISRALATLSTVEVTQAAAALQRPLRHAVSAAVDGLGVTVLDLELVEVGIVPDATGLDLLQRGLR